MSLFVVLGATAAVADDAAHPVTYTAQDTVAPAEDADSDARDCLASFRWEPDEFEVDCRSTPGESYDALLSFPSPLPSGDAQNDRVTLEWYAAREQAENDDSADGVIAPIIEAPAVLVIHESGSGMGAGRAFARALRSRGLHAFMIHLPYYGERRGDRKRPDAGNFTTTMRQGITDARRARDAIAVVPEVDADFIGIQGTSLGGFVTTTAAGIDGCFDGVFIMLAGADLYDIVQSGQKDTAKVRQRLAAAGYEGEKLRELLRIVEPSTLAHRLDPETTWTYSAQQDEVVPIKNARLLAAAANLDRSHQLEMPGGHYSVAVFLPFIVDHIVEQVRDLAGSGASE